MLKLIDTNLSFVFELEEKKVVFPLKIINKRNLVIEHQEDILNEYFYYKGYEWIKKVFDLLRDIHDEITISSANKQLETIESLNLLIDMIDIDDIKMFLEEIKKIRIPKNLISEFSNEMKEEGRWSQEQTFTVNDYKNLAAEAIRLKILLGPLNYYYYVNSNKFKPVLVEYTLVKLLLGKLTETSPALIKVRAMVSKLITTIDFKAVIIDKKLPAEELGDYVTCIIMLQRIATATILKDDETKNIITTIYSYGYNKLTISGDISKIIRDKIPVNKDENEQASVIENYKAVTLVTPGDITKILWVSKSIPFILKNSPQYLIDNVNLKSLEQNRHKLNIFKDDSISDFTKLITKKIIKKTINQKALNYLPIENMEHYILICYEFLIEIGFKDIAELYISREIDYTEISLNTLRKKDKLLFSKLEDLYLGAGEPFVNILTNKLMTKNWVNYSGPIKIPENIINDLASLLITVEENYNKEK